MTSIPDIDALKSRLKSMWMAGDYGHFAQFSPAEVVEFFRTYYGPTNRAFVALESEPEKQSALRRDLENHWRDHNTAQDGGTAIEAEYLEVVAVKAKRRNTVPGNTRIKR